MENVLEFTIGAGILVTIVNMMSKTEEDVVEQEVFSASDNTVAERTELAKRQDFTGELRVEHVPLEGGKYGELRPQYKWV